MVKASGQIKQELASLQDKTEVMADALEPLYEGYLKALSEASKRQLVQAAYYLCTQAYPDKFLALSWDQRNELQKGLQAIAANIYDQLLEQRSQSKKMSRRPQKRGGLLFLQRLLEARGASVLTERLSEGSEDRQPSGRDNDEPLAEERYEGSFSSDIELERLEDSDIELTDFDLAGSELAGSDEEDQTSGDRSTPSADYRFEDDFSDLEDDADFETSDADDDDSDIDYEMEVPAADERLTLEEEDDLLAALEGLARRSIELNGQTSLAGTFSSSQSDIFSSRLSGGSDDAEGDADDEAAEEKPLSPLHLIKQQMLLEKAIREVFKSVSDEVNDLLQEANVMPSFPKALMAAASNSRGMGDPLNSVPNVVRVSVRVMHSESMMDNEQEDGGGRSRQESSRGRSSRSGRASSGRTGRGGRSGQSIGGRRVGRLSGQGSGQGSGRSLNRSGSRSAESRRMRQSLPHDAIEIEALPELAAVSLRLSEVEFADPTVSAWRGRLRQKLGDLKKLTGRYKKTQRSLETAQAEDAWRSSWTARADE